MGFFGREIILLVLFSAVSIANGEFGIVEPFPPGHSFPVESESLEITCVAYDPARVMVPLKIEFVRINEYSQTIVLRQDERIYFTNKTEENGTKLSVTLHIRNVTYTDDSQKGYGRYRCYAYAVGNSSKSPAKYAFTINVVRKSEIPKLSVPEVSVLQHDKEASINCKVTDRGDQQTALTRFSWFKGGELLNSQPKPAYDALPPLTIKNVGAKDVANYTCILEVKLRGVRQYNVTDDTTVQIAPWFEKHDGNKEAEPGENVKLQCSARGYPLKVEWKVQTKRAKNITACVDSSTDKRFKISRDAVDGPYVMSIANLNVVDSGNYYCCLPSNCSAKIEESRCQLFVLSVKGEGAKTSASLATVLGVVAFLTFRPNF